VFGVERLRREPRTSPICPTTPLEIDVPEPAAQHVVTLAQVRRWLNRATTHPNEAVKKVKLKGVLREVSFDFHYESLSVLRSG
jgi:hypothetical protein